MYHIYSLYWATYIFSNNSLLSLYIPRGFHLFNQCATTRDNVTESGNSEERIKVYLLPMKSRQTQFSFYLPRSLRVHSSSSSFLVPRSLLLVRRTVLSLLTRTSSLRVSALVVMYRLPPIPSHLISMRMQNIEKIFFSRTDFDRLFTNRPVDGKSYHDRASNVRSLLRFDGVRYYAGSCSIRKVRGGCKEGKKGTKKRSVEERRNKWSMFDIRQGLIQELIYADTNWLYRYSITRFQSRDWFPSLLPIRTVYTYTILELNRITTNLNLIFLGPCFSFLFHYSFGWQPTVAAEVKRSFRSDKLYREWRRGDIYGCIIYFLVFFVPAGSFSISRRIISWRYSSYAVTQGTGEMFLCTTLFATRIYVIRMEIEVRTSPHYSQDCHTASSRERNCCLGIFSFQAFRLCERKLDA